MKEILRHLVNTMRDMTGKLDSMQSAIDFINKTFHETHEPLFNLKGVLNNMTVSLDNMNGNLKTINQTLKDFKDFLRQFRGTVFNSDDVIRHIDESIKNLGKTVIFIENSVLDLNGTASSISDNIVDINSTLAYVNNSVWDVNHTTIYSNETLDSMIETLESLDKAIGILNGKFNIVTGGIDVFGVSLRNINQTVKNTHEKLESLHGKLVNFNSSLTGVTQQVERLNETYGRINKTLESLNESYMFTNGTPVLGVITKLADMDVKLNDLHINVSIINTNISSMNSSLLNSLDSLIDLVSLLTEFNLRVEENNNSIVIDLKHKDLLETVRMLLNMNGTLSEIGQNVDDINERINLVDQKLGQLEQRLADLDTTLDTIDATFKILNETLRSMNHTVRETNKSLNFMDSTLISMNSTFDEIGITFGNINDTLDTVNKTLSKIRDTSDEVNSTIIDAHKTFLDLRGNLKATNKSTIKLNKTISGIYGSVSDLNSQVHNANESLRILRSKADIAHESYRMLNDTIKRMDETVFEISTKLDETNATMMKTNSSLSYVNNSIMAMQNSFLLLNDELKALERSFQKIDSRMRDFGSAFPHIANVINDTRNALAISKNNLADMDRKLDTNNHTRDELVSKYKTLLQEFSDVAETIDNLEDSLKEMKMLSSDIHNESMTLRSAVLNTENTYSRTEKNVRFINKTHEPIVEGFIALQGNKMMTNTSLNVVQRELEDIVMLLDTQVKKLENDTNIDADIETVRATLNEQKLKFADVKGNYEDWSRTFDNLDGILWDDNRFPTAVHMPYETLVNKTYSVDQTLKDYGNVLNITEKTMSNILQFGKTMRKRFHEIDNMKTTIDQIEGQEIYLKDEIENANDKLQVLDKNLTKLLSELQDKLEDVKLMESTYGDINGTYNVSMNFDEAEAVLISAISDIHNTIQLLDSSKANFGDTVNTYERINNTFYNTTFRLDPLSSRILNETLHVIDVTKLGIVSLKETFNDVFDIIGNTHVSLDDVTKNIMDLEDTLTYQKRKNNYVTKYQPILDEKFNDLFKRYNKTNSVHDKLLEFVNRLNKKTLEIRNQSDDISNVNIALNEEEKQIGAMTMEISNMKNKLNLSKHTLDNAFERFKIYEVGNSTFDEVKAEYAMYRKSTALFENVINEMNSKSDEMRMKGNDISKQLDDIQKILSEFVVLKQPVKKAQQTKIELSDKINDTFSRISQAIIDLQWLDDNFQLIKQNYSNFTATDIDLSDTYVSEAINNTRLHLKNVTEMFSEANVTAFNLFNKIDETTKKYIEHNFERTNIESVMNQFIKPNLNDIHVSGQLIDKILDKITLNVKKIDLSIKGVNDTIHITNDQLFEDRQKKLLADTVFPDLETDTIFANKSISAATNKIYKQIEKLKDVMKVFDDLTERLNNFPTVNISLENESVQLLQFNKTLQNASKRIIEFSNELTDINNTLWLSNNERYLQNETIDNMKTRYKLAQDKLGRLFEDIGNLESVLDLAQNGTSIIDSEMRSLNNSLNHLEDTTSILDTLLKEVSRVDGYLNDTKGVVEQFEKNLNTIVANVDDIKVGFSGINKAIFDQLVKPIEGQIQSQETNIGFLYGNILEAFAKMNAAKENIKTAFNNSKNIKDSRFDLDEMINENKKILSYVNSAMEEITHVVDDVRHDAAGVEKEIDVLDTDVQTMNDVFIQQQKIEYFNENFPNNVYRELNQTLIETIDIETDIKSYLKSTFEHFSQMNSSLSNAENLTFEVSLLADRILSSNLAMGNTSESLQQLLTTYVELENLLYTKDGLLISDNETLDEMKTRYQRMFTEMQDIQSTLDGILQSFKNHNMSLHKTSGDITAMDSLIQHYENIIKDVNNTENQMQDWNATVNHLDDTVRSFATQYDEGKSVFEALKSNFSGINSTIIANLTDAIFDHIENLTTLIETFELDSGSINKTFDEAKSKLTQYAKTIKVEQGDTDKLGDLLDMYQSVNQTVSNSMDSMTTVNDSAINSEDLINRKLQQLNEDLQTLKRMYEEEEKIDYLEKHTPVLQRKLRDSKRLINGTFKEIEVLNSSSVRVSELLQTVSENISKERSVDVTLSPIVDRVRDWNDKIDVSQSKIKDLEEIVVDIKIDMFGDGELLRIENVSIEFIKNTYESLNKTLNEVMTNTSHIKQSAIELQEHVFGREQWLKEFTTDMDKLASLQKDVQKVLQLTYDTAIIMNGTDEVMNNTNHTIVRLLNELHDLSVDFSSVKSDNLKRKSQILDNKVTDLFNKYNLVNKIYNNTKHEYQQVKDDIETLTNLMDNVSYSLDDIKEKINQGHLLHEKIDEAVLTTHQTSHGIKNDTSLRTNADELGKEVDELKKLYLEHQKLDYVNENAPELKKKMNMTIEGIKAAIKDIQGANSSKEVLKKLYKSVETVISKDVTIDIPLSLTENVIDIINDNITSLSSFAEKLEAKFFGIDSNILSDSGSFFTENDTLNDVVNMFEDLNKTLDTLDKHVRFVKVSLNYTFGNINNESSFLDTLTTESEKLIDIKNKSAIVEDLIFDMDHQLDNASSALFKQKQRIMSMGATLGELYYNITFLKNASLKELAADIRTDIDVLHNQYNNTSKLLNETEDDFYFIQTDFKALNKVMRNTSKTLNDLQERTREALSLQKHITKEMKIVNNSYVNVSKNIDMENGIKAVNNKIENLREKIIQQEKLEYIQKHAPVLKQKLKVTSESLQHAEEKMVEVNSSIGALDMFLDEVKDKTHSETSVKIQFYDISETIEDAKQELSRLVDLANLTNRNMLDIDEYMLSEDGSYFSLNDSLADIIHAYNRVYDLLADVEKNVSFIKTSNMKTIDVLGTDKNSLQNVMEQVDKFTAVKNLVNTTSNEFQKIDDIKDAKTRASEDVLNQIMNLNETLNNVTTMYKDVNDDDLKHDSSLLLKQINHMHGQYLKNIRAPLNETNSRLSLVNDTLGRLFESVEKDVYTVKDLENKTKAARNSVLLISENVTSLGTSLEAINHTLTDKQLNISALEININDLRDRFKKQQIYDYIKEHFPTLLEKMNNVNTSLTHLDEKLPLVNSSVDQLVDNAMRLSERLAAMKQVNISLGEMFNGIDSQKDAFIHASDKTDMLEQKFNMLHDIISSNIDSNETLEDIKIRFKGYETKLHKMVQELNGIKEDLNDTNSGIRNMSLQLDLYHDSINDFYRVEDRAKARSSQWLEANQNFENVTDKIHRVNDEFDIQVNFLNDTVNRFSSINSTELHNERLTIEQRLVNGEDNLKDLISDFNRTKYNFDELGNMYTNASKRLEQNITSFEELNDISKEVNDILNKTMPQENDIKETLNKNISTQMLSVENNLSNITDQIENLRSKLLEKEKLDFVQLKIQEVKTQDKNIRQLIEDVEKHITGKEEDVSELNETRHRVQEKLNTRGNLVFSTEDLNSKAIGIKTSIGDEKMNLVANTENLDQLAVLRLPDRNWENMTIEKIKSIFSDLNNNITDINSSILVTKTAVDELEIAIDREFEELNRTNELLNTYSRLENNFNHNIKDLRNLSDALNTTSEFLQSTSNKFDLNSERLQNLSIEYPGVNISDMEETLNMIKEIHGKVTLRLPLASRIFQRRFMENYNIVSERFDDISDVLFGNFTSRDGLENVIGDVEDSLINVTLETEKLSENNKHFHEDSKQLLTLLHNSTSQLDKLEIYMKNQAKYDLLNANLPDLKTEWKRLHDTNKAVMSDLDNSSNTQNSLTTIVKNISARIENISAVNISTENISNQLKQMSNDTQQLSDQTKSLEDKLMSIPVFDIDIGSLATNSAVSILDVQSQLQDFRNNLKSLDKNSETLKEDVKILNTSVSELYHNTSSLNDTLNTLDDVQYKLNVMNNSIIVFKEQEAEATSRLADSDRKLISYKDALADLKTQYKQYKYDTSDVEILLNITEDTIVGLRNNLLNAENVLVDATKEYNNMDERLYTMANKQHILNETLMGIELDYPLTVTKLDIVNNTLKEVLSKIPNVFVQLTDIEDQISTMNDTLKAEHMKSSFIDHALPVLQDKYDRTNKTFLITNATLERMAKEIAELSQFVETLKQRMNDFSNINISMTDIDSNVTYLENRLIIMQDHYNDVTGIVKALNEDINKNNIFGRNITLVDVKDQYTSFNGTLDRINEILTKINHDATEAGEHFDLLNTTAKNIDKALDVFEEKSLDVKAMEKDVDVLGKQLADTNTNINTMDIVITNLSKSLDDMKLQYSDVFDYTAENNSAVIQMLETTNRTISGLKQILKNLDHSLENTVTNFVDMNGTLFENITTYVELNDTLGNVTDKYVALSKTIHKLEHGISKATEDTEGTNSSLSQLSSMLRDLNDTLFREQEKFNFIKNNLGGLEAKFQSLKTPIETTGVTLRNVSDKVNTTEHFVDKVAIKLKQFGNIQINLDDEVVHLQDMNDKIAINKALLSNFSKSIDMLEKRVQSLDRTKNITEIASNYDEIDSSLDGLQSNLTSMLSALEEINFNTDIISSKTNKLDAALNELSVLDNSSRAVNGSLDNLGREIDESDSTINEIKTNTDGLFDAMKHMEDIYSGLDNEDLKKNLTYLIAKLNDTNLALIDADNTQRDIMRNHLTVYADLKNIQNSMHGEIRNQTALDTVTRESKGSLETIMNDTKVLKESHVAVKANAFKLMSEVENLTNELNRLNETMAEEKRKQEFMAENFPHISTRYNALNTAIGTMNGTLNDTSRNVDAVAKKLMDVKQRLDAITAISIPLDTEEKQIARIQQNVKSIMEEYQNVSNTYEQLKMSELQDKHKSFKELKLTYNDYNNTLSKLERTLDRMNADIGDLNISAGVIDESMSDISFTVDEYIDSGEKISNLISSGDLLTNSLKSTNESVSKMSLKLQNLNESLESLLKNFSHIDDPGIKQTKDLLKTLFLASRDKINVLQQDIGNLHGANQDSHGLISNMNDTHSTTKTALGQLKQHIQQINETSQSVEANLERIDSQRAGINNSTENLNPELEKLMNKINELASNFLKEQEKNDVIALNKPLLERRLKNLREPLAATNGHISLTEVKLADLKYNIKTTGTRLDKFKTISIKTDTEAKDWDTMNTTVIDLAKNFTDIRKKYESLQNEMKTLNDRSITKTEIDDKIRSVNKTLSAIEDGLSNINENLKNTEGQIESTDRVLQGLSKSMDNFKELQTETAKTETTMKATKGKMNKLQNMSGDLTQDISTLDEQMKTMNTLYAPLNDKTWNSVKGKITKGISTISQNIGRVNKTVDGLDKRLTTTSTNLDKLVATTKNKIMTRNNIDTSVSSLRGKMKQVGTQLSNMQSPVTTQSRQMTTLQTSANKVKSTVNRLNSTLHKELLKYNYVKDNLPPLKGIHSEVNQSFIANIPDMDSMKSQITNLVSIITKIKDKMTMFGLEDTDLSLKKWDEAIQKLNKTVTMIIKKNKETSATLNNLKQTLWSKSPMYTRKETVSDVQTRFGNINKTLDDIKAASHTIKISLNDVSSKASEVIMQLIERDSILTTTPATTTPSGPPDWLTMNSSFEGVIGKDSGFVECSATDLNEWQVMKITRINRDGIEQPIAGWKLGTGARKAVRDKRIRAKRTMDANTGKLTVGIQTLQCEDEGSYYCSIDSYNMWPLETTIDVTSPPEDNLKPDFPTEVFEDKITNFSCTGHPGYPNGRLSWKIKHDHEAHFKPIDFYSSKRKVSDAGCVRTETNIVEFQFNMTWNNTRVRCYVENTDFYAEGKVQLLPYDICNKVRYLGTISHPYTPHKYIVCGKELNIMQCPGDTCYDVNEENCIQCKAGHGVDGDPCRGKPDYTYVAHEYDCKKYYLCLGKTKTPKKCAKGFFAPHITGNCVLSYAQSLCGQKEGSAGR